MHFVIRSLFGTSHLCFLSTHMINLRMGLLIHKFNPVNDIINKSNSVEPLCFYRYCYYYYTSGQDQNIYHLHCRKVTEIELQQGPKGIKGNKVRISRVIVFLICEFGLVVHFSNSNFTLIITEQTLVYQCLLHFDRLIYGR